MHKICVYNTISEKGLAVFPQQNYEFLDAPKQADAILLRSHSLHEQDIPGTIKAIARAGAGVNNVPIEQCTLQGIPVFNTPGANANAVKELVIAGLLLAARHICSGWDYTRHLQGDDAVINHEVEQAKKQFAGFELPGKTLAVIGLGAIGLRVANAAIALGMRVIGYDPAITIQHAWQLSAQVEQAATLPQAIAQADFVTLHVPYNEQTKHLINTDTLAKMQANTILLNFARGPIVDNRALLATLETGHIARYVCDFPANALHNNPNVIALPHLGASTQEAQENCAVMAATQLRRFLEDGEIVNAVNFPDATMPRTEGYRLSIVNANVPNMLGQISTTLADHDFNIIDMLNKSRGEIAYTLVDVSQPLTKEVLKALTAINGILRVHAIHS